MEFKITMFKCLVFPKVGQNEFHLYANRPWRVRLSPGDTFFCHFWLIFITTGKKSLRPAFVIGELTWILIFCHAILNFSLINELIVFSISCFRWNWIQVLTIWFSLSATGSTDFNVRQRNCVLQSSCCNTADVPKLFFS